ncbi:MAG: Gx transporter family protein [Clostridia bacterium]|nr:Gx transporter family protein [Clostridia bacterium]MDE7401074.1 Gx transporter family protein [Clostridia bacterium]
MGEKRFTAKKLAVLGVLTALSLITFLIENLFPPLLIPGAKLGLANAFSFIALVMFSPLEAFIIVGVRTILGAVFAGNLSAVLYSFTGGVVSMAVSSVLIYCVHPKISLICVSVVAAAFHNFTQNAVFVLLSSTPLAFYYAPYLILLGVLSGAFIGAAVTLIVKRVPTKVFLRVTGLTNNNHQKNIEEG